MPNLRRARDLALALLLALAPAASGAQEDAESAAWDAAMALKTAGRGAEGAAAFEAFVRDHPGSPRASEARVEAGVCHMLAGRAAQQNHRNNPLSIGCFRRSLERLREVHAERPDDPLTPRALYCAGTAHVYLDEMPEAEAAYGSVIEDHAGDRAYLAKSLERRAAVRRHRLDAAGAIADLERYQAEIGAGGSEAQQVARYLNYARAFEKPAPDWEPEQWVWGEPLRLEELRGRTVFLYFFASWCHNCEKEIEFIRDLHARLEPFGVQFVGVTDHSEGQRADDVRAYMSKNGLRFPVMMDRGRVQARYRTSKLPDLVILDKRGRVRWHDHPAQLYESTIEAFLLEEDPAAPEER